MILAPNLDAKINTPQSVLRHQEIDPRKSEISEYLDGLRKYVLESMNSLHDGQVKALDSDFAQLGDQLERLQAFKEGWDGYDAPAPSADALSTAREVLRGLQRELVRPQRVSASADGGVAFSFKASANRRAQIEILNNGERFAHLYDLQGNSYTYDWPMDSRSECLRNLIEPILNYMHP